MKKKAETAPLLPHTHQRRVSKIRPVPIDKMRVPPELITQRPFRKAHGDKMAADLDLDKLGFPVINHRDGHYWVLDGQHRIYALKQNGFTADTLDCEVYENLTDPEMADIFLGRDDRRALTVFDKFHVSCTAGRVRELGIRRAVESNKLRISRNKDEGCIGAISALGRVYDLGGGGDKGEVILGQALRTIRDAYAADPSAFDGHIIAALGMVFHRYNGRTNERALADRLGKLEHGHRAILRRAATLQERTGNQKAQCIAATVVDIYNRTAGRADKLTPWWKEEAGG